MIKCSKYLKKVTQVDQRTGEETDVSERTEMFMLPPKAGVCQVCATDHEDRLPHNAQSMFYQYSFYNEHGRWPTWIDAMAHCDERTKTLWTQALADIGVKL